MNYKKLIQHAWILTNSHPKLIWYGFIPALLGTMVGTVYLMYQGFAFWAYFNDISFITLAQNYGQTVLNIITSNIPLTIFLAAVALVVFVLYLFVPIILHGGLVKLLPNILFNKRFQYRSGLPLGLIYFFPLFKYNATIAPFSPISLLFFCFMLLRNLGPEAVWGFLPLIIFFFILDLIVILFFTFAQYFIVLDNQKYFEAMRNSMKLVFMNLEATLFLLMLMGMIAIRIVLNFVGVFLVPGVIIFVTYTLASGALQTIGLWIGIIAGIGGIIFISYLTGILNVFITTLWTMTFYSLLHRTQGFQEMLEEEAKVADV